MLETYALKYIELGGEIEKLREAFTEAFNSGDHDLSAPDRESLRLTLRELTKVSNDLELSVAVQTVRRAEFDLPQTIRELDQLIYGIYAELKSRKLFYVPAHLSLYYESSDILSDRTLEAFPRASEEIREAANCFALERYTATVFHAMRAAEIGLKALGEKLVVKIKNGKSIELAEWREILDGLSIAMRDFEGLPNATPNKDEDLRVYSEACAQFRFFKNGWRIRVAHARATYTEAPAKEVLDHIRTFFEVLSERLQEPL